MVDGLWGGGVSEGGRQGRENLSDLPSLCYMYRDLGGTIPLERSLN